ncbi:MAG: AmmeMemoRadiSam system protein A [Dactylosporangium sp.]|nr:AmmeMemoRadiSam system protein A [Dactylosporangium sp.]NNJ62614.1 AmmeMemoRadiSam system protein A [Dactylosporangium sp.]
MGLPEMPHPELTPNQGAALVALAAHVVAARLLDQPFQPAEPAESALRTVGSSFVTLERAGALRGCVGALEPTRPLYLDVARNALRAMADPRLPAVAADEWCALDVSVSVLSESQPIPASGIEELASALRPGVDGVILTDGRRRATFLPAVWQRMPSARQFVAALLLKGGWSRADGPELMAWRYVATEVHSPAPRPPLAEVSPPAAWVGAGSGKSSPAPDSATSSAPDPSAQPGAGAADPGA